MFLKQPSVRKEFVDIYSVQWYSIAW